MRKQKGIILIALIITIVILLILSGVIIPKMVGENGIINRAKEATDSYQLGKDKEKVRLVLNDYKTNKIVENEGTTVEKIKE